MIILFFERLGIGRKGEGFGSQGRTRTYDQLINSQLLYQLSYRGILKVFIYIAELNRKIFFGSFFVTIIIILKGKNNFDYKSYTKIIPNRFSQFHIFFISPGARCKMIAVYGQLTVAIYLISAITYVIYNVN